MRNFKFEEFPREDNIENQFTGMSIDDIYSYLVEIKQEIESSFNEIETQLELRKSSPVKVDINLVVLYESKVRYNEKPTTEETQAYALYNSRTEELNELQRKFAQTVIKRQKYKALLREAIKACEEISNMNLDIINGKVH